MNPDKPTNERFESFAGTVDELKKSAAQDNLLLTDQDIIAVLSIPEDVFRQYYAADRAPGEVFARLRSAWGRYLRFVVVTHIFREEIDDPFPDGN